MYAMRLGQGWGALMKKCTKCGVEKPFSDFHKNNRTKDGLIGSCKSCVSNYHKTYYERNKAHMKTDSLRRYSEDKEKHKARFKAWRERNPGYDAEKSRAWRKNNPGAYQRWLEENPSYHRAWRQENPELVRAYARKRRALIQENGWEEYTEAEVIEIWGDACVYCGGPFEHLDHVHPISKGGSDTLDNVVPSCAPCNYSKGAKTLEEWELAKREPAQLRA